MKDQDIQNLSKVVRTQYLARQQDLQEYLQREAQLRAELSRLDQQARSAEEAVHHPMQTIGADIIWKSWVGRTKVELNLQLAQTLAEKEQYVQRVRDAYGKVLVADQLGEKHRCDKSRQQNSKVLEKTIASHLQMKR
ncbi:hypothetical protein [uncultured Roseobacter sp.]|uniref:hypothetical protein n=1 Tax=uncultured Roseobacter sp. TaxID=114847 RepID=UPI0026319C33|nr:hypothetical protein [uncultured Roseobacter sp.]